MCVSRLTTQSIIVRQRSESQPQPKNDSLPSTESVDSWDDWETLRFNPLQCRHRPRRSVRLDSVEQAKRWWSGRKVLRRLEAFLLHTKLMKCQTMMTCVGCERSDTSGSYSKLHSPPSECRGALRRKHHLPRATNAKKSSHGSGHDHA